MASALARGSGEPALVADIDAGKAEALAAAIGEAVGSNAELAEKADAIVLCHKPKQLEEVAAEAAEHARHVVSILAATSTTRSRAHTRRRDLPLHPQHAGGGPPRGALLRGRPGAAGAPEDEILELMGRTGTHPAGRRAADRARDGPDELR